MSSAGLTPSAQLPRSSERQADVGHEIMVLATADIVAPCRCLWVATCRGAGRRAQQHGREMRDEQAQRGTSCPRPASLTSYLYLLTYPEVAAAAGGLQLTYLPRFLSPHQLTKVEKVRNARADAELSYREIFRVIFLLELPMGHTSAFLTPHLPVTRLDPNFVPDVSLECTVAGVSGSASPLSTEREHRKLLGRSVSDREGAVLA